jgi:hypothetical protein
LLICWKVDRKPETHTKRQATQHDCLSCLPGDGSKGIGTMYCLGNKFFLPGRLEQPWQNKNLFYQHDKPNKPTKEGPLLFVLFESPFTSVSTVSRGHPSLVSLPETIDQLFYVELITPEEKQRANVFRMFVKEGESYCVVKPCSLCLMKLVW